MEWFEMLEILESALGSEQVSREICKMLGTYEAEDLLSTMMLMWDIDPESSED